MIKKYLIVSLTLLILTPICFARPTHFEFKMVDVEFVKEPLLVAVATRTGEPLMRYKYYLPLNSPSYEKINPDADQLVDFIMFDRNSLYTDLPKVYLLDSCKLLKAPDIFTKVNGDVLISIQQVDSMIWGKYYEANCLYVYNTK